MRELALAALLLAAPGSRLPDPGQLAMPARPDAQGLLRVDPTYYRMSAETGGDCLGSGVCGGGGSIGPRGRRGARRRALTRGGSASR